MSATDRMHRTQLLIDRLDDAQDARIELRSFTRAFVETPSGPWAGMPDEAIVIACRAGYHCGIERRAEG